MEVLSDTPGYDHKFWFKNRSQIRALRDSRLPPSPFLIHAEMPGVMQSLLPLSGPASAYNVNIASSFFLLVSLKQTGSQEPGHSRFLETQREMIESERDVGWSKKNDLISDFQIFPGSVGQETCPAI